MLVNGSYCMFAFAHAQAQHAALCQTVDLHVILNNASANMAQLELHVWTIFMWSRQCAAHGTD